MGNHSSTKTNEVKAPHQEELGQLYMSLCHYGILSKELFEKHFHVPNTRVASNLFERYFIDLLNSSAQTRFMFVERSHAILKNADRSTVEEMQFYFDLISNNKRELIQDNVAVIFANCAYIALSQSENNINFDILKRDYLIRGIATACMNGTSTISRNNIINWVNLNFSNIFSGFQRWLQYKFTGIMQKGKVDLLPLPEGCLSSELLLTPSVLWYLCSILPSCYTSLQNKYDIDSEVDTEIDLNYTWHILYDSNQHGLSLNRFKHKIMDYKSSTITFIQFSSGLTIVLGLDERWIDSPDKFGGPYCHLIELSPSTHLVEENSKMVYLKELGRSIPTGLIIGSGIRPKIKMSIDFSTADICYKSSMNESVERIEVWGCGGEAAMKQQASMKKWEQKEIEKRKKVKLPGQWDTDQVILEMAGVTVNHSQR